MTDQMIDVAATLAGREMRLFLGGRPGKKSMARLASLQLTHCCTLLSEREDVQPVAKICQKLGCEWVWLPIEGGRLDVLRNTNVIGHIETLLQQIEGHAEPRVYFHCAAGIHRTGFFVYILLRLRGLDRTAAVAELANLRAVTADQVGEERLDLADTIVAERSAAPG